MRCHLHKSRYSSEPFIAFSSHLSSIHFSFPLFFLLSFCFLSSPSLHLTSIFLFSSSSFFHSHSSTLWLNHLLTFPLLFSPISFSFHLSSPISFLPFPFFFLQVICEKIFRPWFSPTLLGAKAGLPLQVGHCIFILQQNHLMICQLQILVGLNRWSCSAQFRSVQKREVVSRKEKRMEGE